MGHSDSFEAWRNANRAVSDAEFRFHLLLHTDSTLDTTWRAELEHLARLRAHASSLVEVLQLEIAYRGERAML